AAIRLMMAIPTAARGGSQGRIPVTIGSISPVAARTSVIPVKTTRERGSPEKPVHRSRPRPRILGTPAPKKNRARNPCALQRATFANVSIVVPFLQICAFHLNRELVLDVLGQ